MPVQTNRRNIPDNTAAPGGASLSSASAASSEPPAAFAHQSGKTHLPLYRFLSRLPGPRNFAVRIFLFSFLGTQLPLFILLLWLIVNVELTAEVLTTFSIILIAALLGSASTVLALIAYTEPVNAVSRAMQNFSTEEFEPDLPNGPGDEIGELMTNTQDALRKLQGMLHNMHELSIRDELTGLYNRRFFTEQASQLLQRATRYDEPLTLIFIDLDNFKLINDTFSHQTGDSALRLIARLMSETARGSDLTARIGGDEFVMMFPNTPMHKAVMLSERLRSNLQRHDWSALLPGVMPTISVGMSEAQAHDSVEKLIGRADANLHKAKSEGRNQIQV